MPADIGEGTANHHVAVQLHADGINVIGRAQEISVNHPGKLVIGSVQEAGIDFPVRKQPGQPNPTGPIKLGELTAGSAVSTPQTKAYGCGVKYAK